MKVVALGGGHGLSRTLQAVRRLSDDVVAIVSTADDGGSSGRLREEFSVPPPGDLRMALLALADSARVDEQYLWAHRFAGTGPLAGHNLGNLMLTALWQRYADDADAIVKGLQSAADMLGVVGQVLPVTSMPHHLIAAVEQSDGMPATVVGQSSVTTTPHRIKRVQAEPESVTLDPQARQAIAQADLIVLGPGSWFTSVLAVLCVDGVCDAINASGAAVAVVLNLRAQPGEAEGYEPLDYVTSLTAAHPALRVDAWVLDSQQPAQGLYEHASSHGCEVIVADVADSTWAHDPERLSKALAAVKIRTL